VGGGGYSRGIEIVGTTHADLGLSVCGGGVVDGGAVLEANLQYVARLALVNTSRLSGDGGSEEEERDGGNQLL
jgi:hypothetical protein